MELPITQNHTAANRFLSGPAEGIVCRLRNLHCCALRLRLHGHCGFLIDQRTRNVAESLFFRFTLIKVCKSHIDSRMKFSPRHSSGANRPKRRYALVDSIQGRFR